MRYLSFLVNDEHYALDVSLVKQVVRNMAFTEVPAANEEIAGISNIKGRVVTVLSLTVLLGRKIEKAEKIKTVCAIILKTQPGLDMTGICIDKPGELLDISDELIFPPAMAIEENEKKYISGMAEINNILYRIINIDLIADKYKTADASSISLSNVQPSDTASDPEEYISKIKIE